MTKRIQQGGFTLVEILVALVLAGLVTAAAVGLPNLFARFDRQMERDEGLRDGVASASRLLRALAEGAVPDLPARNNPIPNTADKLTLLSWGPPILALDRPAQLTLRVVTENGQAALRMSWADPASGIGREEPVLEGAQSIRLSYFSAQRGEGGGRWLPEWSRPWALPAAILLRIEAPEIGPPIDLIARTRAQLPEACLLLPQEPACQPKQR